MHICLVGIEYPIDTNFGGISTYQFLLAKSLAKLNNKVTVICGTDKDDYDYYENDIHVIRLHTKRDTETIDTFLSYRKKVKEIIYEIDKTNRIDIIETPEFSGEIIEFLKERKIPVVVKLHTSYKIWSSLNNIKLPLKLHNLIIKTENSVLKNADKITCCSNLLKELMPRYHEIENNEKIEVIGNPANIYDFYPTKNNHESNTILFCGSVERRKGIFILAKAIPIVIDKLKDKKIKFQLIGNYSTNNKNGINQKEELLESIPEKYHKYIEFTGPIDNKELNEYFNKARIGIIPSLFDNLPYVAMEELLTELPIVASSNTGIKEMITDNESGLLYPPEDYKLLAELIIKLYQNKEFAKKIGINGRKEILNKFSPNKIAKENINIYKKTIKEFKNNESKMHVCLVNYEYPIETSLGGISTYQKRIADALYNNNCKVTVICGSLDVKKDYYEDGIHVIRVPKNFPYRNLNDYYTYRKEISKLIKEINQFDKIDVVESPELSAEIVCFLKNQNIPVVTKLHTSYTFIKKFNNESAMFPKIVEDEIMKNENYIINNSNMVTCCSEILKELMPKYHEIENNEKIEVIGNPANIYDFYPTKNNHESNTILFCGSVERRKGIFILAKAIPIVIDKLKDKKIKFQLIGNYSTNNKNGINQKEELLESIPEKYHKYIEFTGPIDNKELNEYFNKARIGIIPSLFDNLPYVAMEELLTELPIVASSNTGIKEMITDNESGLLYPPEDYKLLAELIIKLYQNKEFAKKIGINGRKEILNKFSPNKIAKENIKIYQSAIKDYNEKNEIDNICKKLELKNIRKMKNGIANYVIKCKYKDQVVIVKFYSKLKNYDYDFIKKVINNNISCNKLIEYHQYDNYNVGIYSFINGRIKRYFSNKMLIQLFDELNKLYTIKLNKHNSYTIYDKVDNYYNSLKNINDKIIKEIIKVYEKLDIYSNNNVILHGDLVYTNIIWNNKINLIDFDETIIGPIEYELASFLIKNCFENGKFDYKYAVKIINFYKAKTYSLSTIKNCCYFYIIKVLMEKLYYSHLYGLNLESNSQKKDYWLWWYNLLKEIELIDMK